MGGVRPPQPKQCSNTSWVSYSSTQFWYYMPRDSVKSHRLRAQSCKTIPLPPHQTPTASPCGHLCFWPAPSLGLINLLEGLTEFIETFYLLSSQFIIKGCNWEMHRARYAEGPRSFRALSRRATTPKSPRVHQPGSPPNLVLWVFMEASLHSHDWLNY